MQHGFPPGRFAVAPNVSSHPRRLEQAYDARAVRLTIGPVVSLDAGYVVAGGIVGPVGHDLVWYFQPAAFVQHQIAIAIWLHGVISAIGDITALSPRVGLLQGAEPRCQCDIAARRRCPIGWSGR